MWLAAAAAVTVISLFGIFGGVLVVPIMNNIFYQHMVQFLVALAVGTLAGDALLHLLPHAMMVGLKLSHEELEEFEQAAIWRSFIALMAFVIFFILERLLNVCGEWRQKRKKKNGGEKKVHIIRSGHRASNKAVGENLCKHKYSSYCVKDVIDAETVQALKGVGKEAAMPNPKKPYPLTTLPEGAEEAFRAEESDIMVGPGDNNVGVTAKVAEINEKDGDAAATLPQGKSKNDGNVGTGETASGLDLAVAPDPLTYDTVFVREHETQHHGHSHAHSHLHSKPQNISSVGKPALKISAQKKISKCF